MQKLDLFEEGRRRFYASPRPDWKSDLKRLYERWMVADDAHRRAEIEDEMVCAYAPFLFWKSSQYVSDWCGVTHEDAFYAGLSRFQYSLKKFDVADSPRGTVAFSSYLMNLAMLDMLKALQSAQRKAHREPDSLDEFLDVPFSPQQCARHHDVEMAAADIDTPEEALSREEIWDITERTIARMSPRDALLARCMLIDEMTWGECCERLREAGHDETRDWLRTRFECYIRPTIAEALTHAGYTPGA